MKLCIFLRLFIGLTDDAVKMAKILHDSALNFKFSVLQKATGSFDDAHKLGQGGFGTVYKVSCIEM